MEVIKDTLPDLNTFQLTSTEISQSARPETSRALISIPQTFSDRRQEQNKPMHLLSSDNTEEVTIQPITYIYYKSGSVFKNFTYLYHLTRNCKSRVDLMRIISNNAVSMPKHFMIKIGIAGTFTSDDLKLISKRTGKPKISDDCRIWEASPILCFQNDLSSESALAILRGEKACHVIFVNSHFSCLEKEEADDPFIFVDLCKEQIKEAIATCLVVPLHRMLQEWFEVLKTKGPNELHSEILSEIQAIRKQLALCTSSKRSPSSVLPSNCTNSVIPDNVKEFLFRKPGVHSFGIWRYLTFKVFISKTADDENLKVELMKINKIFFSKYPLEIEKRKLMEKPTMKQGDPLLSKIPNVDENYKTGTLGGFVTKTDDASKIYALTCNHVFPFENQVAYTENAQGCNGFGNCVFTTREKSCDFAAIEIMETFLDNCDVAFRNTMKKKINARVHSENLQNLGVVHKIGAQTNLTNGYIVSPEYYDKLKDENNREYIFLVEGTGKYFSDEGDSGSLVFSVRQNYVDVVGMVYANNPEVYEEESENEKDNTNPHDIDSSQRQANTSTSKDEKEYAATGNEHDAKSISFCYRIHTALQLFEENQGEDFSVKFRDDLPSSTSDSSESDHSNEETH